MRQHEPARQQVSSETTVEKEDINHMSQDSEDSGSSLKLEKARSGSQSLFCCGDKTLQANQQWAARVCLSYSSRSWCIPERSQGRNSSRSWRTLLARSGSCLAFLYTPQTTYLRMVPLRGGLGPATLTDNQDNSPQIRPQAKSDLRNPSAETKLEFSTLTQFRAQN